MPATRSGCVLVTGTSQGFGRAIALAFAKQHTPVVIAARSADLLNKVAEEIVALGAQVLAYPTDVAKEAEVEALIRAAVEQFGGIDVLVNNAGARAILEPLEHFTWDLWCRNFDVDVRGTFHTCRHVVPLMRSQGSGVIINVASMAATARGGLLISYAPAQAALVTFSHCLNASLTGSGAVVHCLCPALSPETDMGRAAVEQFAAHEGITPQAWIDRTFSRPLLSPPMVGEATVEIAKRPEGGVWEVSGKGLEPFAAF